MPGRPARRHHDDAAYWGRLAREVNDRPGPPRRPDRPKQPLQRPDLRLEGKPTFGHTAVWLTALAAPCARHGADPGEPCWAVPRGLCRARTQAPGPAADPTPTPGRGTNQRRK